MSIDPLTITTQTLPTGDQGISYNAPIITTGGITPFSWSISSGVLPNGIVLGPTTGIFSGTTPFCGSFPVEIQAVDSASPTTTTSKGFILTINCASGYQVTGSVVINNGDPTTLTPVVSLAISVAANVYPTQMRFSTNNATWSDWGPYATLKSFTLTGGTGTRYAYVQVMDAAGKVGTFSDTILAPAFYPLTLTFAGTGGGSVSGGMICASGISCPSETFQEGATPIMRASANTVSTFGGWTGACGNKTGDCQVTMNGSQSVAATFTAAPKVKVGAKEFSTLQAAYDDVATTDGAVILMLDGVDPGPLTAGHAVTVTLSGGHNAEYTTQTGMTILQEKILVQKGTVVCDRVTVK